MSLRNVSYTLMALGQVAGCRGRQVNAEQIMAAAVEEILRLEEAQRNRSITELIALAEIREVLGCGDKPMASELAGIIRDRLSKGYPAA